MVVLRVVEDVRDVVAVVVCRVDDKDNNNGFFVVVVVVIMELEDVDGVTGVETT